MALTLKTFLIVCPLVFLGGFVDAIGGGGGLITIPAYLMAGLPAHNAAATNKIAATFGTTVATIRYLKTGKADFGLAIPSVVMALIGAALGTKLALIVPDDALKIVMMAMIPLIAIVVLKNKSLEATDMTPLPRRKEFIIITLFSLIVGLYDGFYGPATGTFFILVYTKIIKKDILTAETNSKLSNLASSISSMLVFLFSGAAFVALGLAAAACSMAGNYIGSGLAIKNGSKIVRIVILGVMALLIIKVIIDYLG